MEEKNYDIILCNILDPLDRKKMTNPHRKCVRNLCSLYMQLLYTFWMHLVNFRCP